MRFAYSWEQRKVSTIASDTRGGGTPATSNETYWSGNIPWIQSSDLSEGKLFGVEPRKYISRDGLNNSATQLVPEKSIAVVTRVGVGKLAFMPFSYTTSQDFLSLCKLQTEPHFTVYALYQMLQGELQAVQGTSIKGMTKDDLLSKSIFAPKDEVEQQQLGSYFRNLDTLITLHQREQNYKKEALMSYTLTKYEKETVLLYNQSHDPITISTYDPGLRRRLREFAARYPELCRRVDKQKYPDYAEYEIQKERVSIRLLPPMSEEKRRVASEKAKAAGLGTKGNA